MGLLNESKNSYSTNRKPWTPERKAMIEKAVRAGWTIKAICDHFGTSHATFRKHFPDYATKNQGQLAGAATRAKRFQESARFAQVAEMVDDGASLNEILRTTGVHPDTTKKYFPEAGWTRAQGQERKILELATYAAIKERWNK